MANASGPPDFLKNKDLAPVVTDANNWIHLAWESLPNAHKKRVREDIAKFDQAQVEYANNISTKKSNKPKVRKQNQTKQCPDK